MVLDKNMQKEKIIKLIPIFAWLIFVSGLLFVWVYLYGMIGKKTESVNEIKTQIKNAELKMEQRRELEKLIGDVTVKKQKIDSVFLNKDKLITFIEHLEDVSRSASVILKINSEESKGSPVFKLSAEGRYEQVFKFLLLLENCPYKTDIKNLSIQEQGSSEKVDRAWKADLELVLLSYENKI